MICPYLKRTVLPICRAKKGALMASNIYELQYHCMSIKHKECPIVKKNRSRRRAGKENKEMNNEAIT
jgi:hypothetical protein